MSVRSPRVRWFRPTALAACGALTLLAPTLQAETFWQPVRVAANFQELEAPGGDNAAVPLFGPEEPAFTDDLQARKEQRMENLKRQIENLTRLIEQQQAAPPVMPQVPDVPPPVEVEEPPTDEAPLNPPLSLDPPAPEPDPAPIHNAAQAQGPQQAPLDEAAAVRGAIDRLALATSLFGTHEWDACLQILKSLDLAHITLEDRLWASYLEAGCHYHSGRAGEAQAVYRRILAEENSGWVGELARWWLDHLNERARLEGKIAELSQVLKNWEEKIGGLAPQP